MIKSYPINAEYFDNCHECGEAIDRKIMYIIEIKDLKFKFCYSCATILNKNLNRALIEDVL